MFGTTGRGSCGRETMTRGEALVKAVRRWGEKAYIMDSPEDVRYIVGCTDPDVRGVGESWEEAFDKAMESEPAG
jgi:hypothetical protein